MKRRIFIANTWLLALILCVMAVLQLLDFEEFADIIIGYGVTTESGSIAIAVGLIGLEVFALPYLLGLKLSRLANELSSLFAVLAPLAWVVLISQELLVGDKRGISGLFSGFVDIPVGVVSLLFMIIMSLMAFWSFFKQHNPPRWLNFMQIESPRR